MRTFKQVISWLVIGGSLAQWIAPIAWAEELSSEKKVRVGILPANVPIQSSSEYYSTNPKFSLLIPVNIWGDVPKPGIYYVPTGYSLVQAIGAAGGPLVTASSSVILQRNGSTQEIDLYKSAISVAIRENDVIRVEQGYKANLPLVFSAIGAALTAVTLVLVIRNGK